MCFLSSGNPIHAGPLPFQPLQGQACCFLSLVLRRFMDELDAQTTPQGPKGSFDTAMALIGIIQRTMINLLAT